MKDSTRACTFEGCEKPVQARGLCQGHYTQQVKGKKLMPLQPSSKGLTLEQRFWGKVNKTAGCWEWTGSTNDVGYGHIWADKKLKGAHRLSWELVNGPIPDGMVVDHRCHNTRCVKPGHLRVVTNAENGQHLTGVRKNSTSGVRGVSWDEQTRAWRACAVLNGRRYHAGRYPTIEAAEAAVKALRASLHPYDDHDEWVGRAKHQEVSECGPAQYPAYDEGRGHA